MTLDEALHHMLTANTKGLQKIRSEFDTVADDLKQLVEQGDLAALKRRFADLRGKISVLSKLCENVQDRLTDLTTDEKGGILDLSVPAHRRS